MPGRRFVSAKPPVRRFFSAPNRPSASGGRGLIFASVFTEDGRLVASVSQEGLIRVRA